jgi:putative peptidoglycan lipid II flippase
MRISGHSARTPAQEVNSLFTLLPSTLPRLLFIHFPLFVPFVPLAPVTDSSENSSAVSLRSVSLLTLLSFGQMLILFVLQLILARAFGTSEAMDAYLAAYSIPLMVGGILAGLISTVVVPIFSELRSRHDTPLAEAAISRLGLELTALAALIGLGIAVTSEMLIGVLFSSFAPLQSEQATEALRILSWLIPLNALTGFLFGVEHVRGQFLRPAASGVVGPLLTIALFLSAPEQSIAALAWAVLGGTILSVVILVVRYPRFGGGHRPLARASWRRFWVLSLPLVLSAAYLRVDVFVDRLLASELPPGSISQMGYAWRIATAVVALATSGLSIVVFPAFARHAAGHDWSALRSDLQECWRFLTVLTIPILAGIAVCGKTIIIVLFERGVFTSSDSEMVSRMLILYGGVILASGVGEIAARTFYAMGRNWIPTLVGLTGFVVVTAVKVGFLEKLGALGLVSATSVYRLTSMAIILGCMGHLGLLRWESELPKTFLRTAIATAISVGLAAWVMSVPSSLRVLLGVTLAVLSYVGLQAALGDPFARRAMKFVFSKRSPSSGETNI